jgi:hypothetical protein
MAPAGKVSFCEKATYPTRSHAMDFVQQHRDVVMGSLSGFDRLRFRGSLRWLSCASGMGKYLNALGVRLNDFDSYVNKVTGWICQAGQKIAVLAGRPLQYLVSSSIDKQQRAETLAQQDGITEGLVGVFKCVEPCWSFGIGRDHNRHIQVKRMYRKCSYYYFYWIDPQMGLMHLRLQSWFPFAIHVCLNGREWLCRQLEGAQVGYRRRENCLVQVADMEQAQRLLDRQLQTDWSKCLNRLVDRFHPVHRQLFDRPYYWALEQSEWATDVMFRDAKDLGRLYPPLIQHSMQHLGCREILRFLGRRVPSEGILPSQFAGQVTADLRERPEGMRVKYRINDNSIKMYDKQGSVLRIETTINDPRDIKVFREGQDGRGHWERLRKGVADLHRRAEVSQAANERYLESLATVEDRTPLGDLTRELCRRVRWKGQPVRGLNPLGQEDARLLETVGGGEFLLTGFRNRDLVRLLYGDSRISRAEQRRRSGSVTRKIRLLRAHGLIHKVSGSYRYKLSPAGQRTIAALLSARAADTKKLMDAA